MKATLISTFAALFVATVSAQVVFNPNGTITCPAVPAEGNGAFCAGDSLQTNIIIRCANGIGQPGNCNDNLAGVPPIGVKLFAPCYQTSPTAGDAACSFNGTAYPDNGAPFKIPAGGNATATVTTASQTPLPTYTANGTGSATVSATATPTPSIPPFTGMAAGIAVQGTILLGGLGAVAAMMGMM